VHASVSYAHVQHALKALFKFGIFTLYTEHTHKKLMRMLRLRITLQRKKAENLKQIFPENEYRGLSANFHIHVSVSELYIPTMSLPFLLEEIQGADDKLGQTLWQHSKQ
jgi:hypothetical protein